MRGLPILDRMGLAWKAMTQMFDAQSATVARGMLGGIFPASTGPVPARGTLELLNTVNESPWIRACAGKLADCMTGVSWKLSVVKGKGSPRASRDVLHIQKAGMAERRALMKELRQNQELVDIPNHAMLDTLRKGNSLLTGGEIRWLMSIYYDMIGDVFLLKQRNRLGTPISLYPIPPHWIAETPTPKRPSYRVQWQGWHAEIPQEEMLWMKNPNPVDPYSRGSGLARSLDDELATDEYAAKHTLKFFRNSARPDILVMPQTGQVFGDAERDRFEEWWNERLQGFWRSFKPLFLKTPVEVKLLEQNFRNLQLTELRKHERDTILQVWGMPPEMFGIVAASNRSTIEMAPYIFTTYCQVPRLERWREFLQERLVPEYDDRLILDYVSPVPEDKEFRLKVMTAQPEAFELNEMRELAGLPPDDELDDMRGTRGGPSAVTPPEDQAGDAGNGEANAGNLDDEEAASLMGLLAKAGAKR